MEQCGTRRFWLADDVHICRVDAHILVLDVKTNRYRAVGAAATACVRGLVEGWPTEDLQPDTRQSHDERASLAVARELTRRGILAQAHAGKAATPVRHTAPSRQLLPASARISLRTRLRELLPITASVARASLSLRSCTFEQLIERVRERKRGRTGRARPFDFDLAARLIAQVGVIRPFCYASRNACLFESLMLLELLSRRGMYPDWVFAVRAAPFGAHCWLQQDEVILNDTLEHAQLLTAIMVI